MKDMKNWNQVQDQPQFSNPNIRCVHCAGDHGSHDFPMRHQHHALPTNNPVGSTGINSQYSPHFSQPSPPQHSQHSQSTARSSAPMLMINNSQQFQQGHQIQTTPPVQQQVNQQVRPPQPFNPQFNQYTPPHASPLFAPPQFKPQYPPPYPGQLLQHPPSVHSNITETSELITQVLGNSSCTRIEKMPAKNMKDGRRREKRSSGMTTTTGTGSTRH